MDSKNPVSIFWFRRDLRLDDNAGLYHALKGELPVLPVFIFDKEILTRLEDKDDARVTFIYRAIEDLHKELKQHGSSLLVLYDTPGNAFDHMLKTYNITAVYTNTDYEPHATKRDNDIAGKLRRHNIAF